MSSGPEPEYRSDTMIMVLNKSSWHGLGSAVAGLGVCLLRPTSRGSVRLRQDPSAYPEIDFNMLAADDDRRRLVHGFGVAAQLMMDDEVRALRNEAFATGYSRVVRGLNKPGRVNSAVTKLLSGMLDGPPAIRRLMLKWGIASGDIDERRLADPAWLRSTVERRPFGTYHPAGTCALGDPEAPSTVVAPDCRVVGVDGLRVVDASIMPTVPRANTNLPVLAVAERAAELVLSG